MKKGTTGMGHARWMAAAVVAGSWVSVALAVKPASWTHEQPKDFAVGKLEELVVTSEGEVTLARQSKSLFDAGEEAEVINALARAGDGRLYAATGPKGAVYQIDGEKVTKFATLPDGGTVLSLVFDKDGKLLAGTGGGDQARIYTIDGNGKAEVFHEPAGARYIWSLARGKDGEIYAATGVEGQIFRIDADGKNAKVLADVKAKNVLCLAFGPDGLLYAGTDGDGLIYRVAVDTGKTYVMYDAKEAEISSIVVDDDGVIYASTASAEKARPGKTVADKPGGKPDQPATQNAGATRPANGAPAAETKPGGEARPQPRATPMPSVGRPPGGGRPSGGGPGPDGGGEGNAIYRIDTNGFVTEVFREPVIILNMVEEDGTIYAATGNEGRIYAISPTSDKTVMMAKLEPAQATTILRLPSGDLLVGTANQAKLVRIARRYAEKGTLTSKPMDAGQIVKWGRMTWKADVPAGTKLTISTRSANIEDDESESWEEWSDEMDATAPRQISSAGARFLQYRLTLESTVPDAAPVLRRLEIARIEENQAPRISGMEVLSVREEAAKPGSSPKVKMLAGGGGGFGGGEEKPSNPDYYWVVKWKAEDANGDALQFEVFYRALGEARWVRLEKDLKEPLRIWDTRTVPDGRYELRVVASDVPGNPPGSALTGARLSDPMTVDNTLPDASIDEPEIKGRSAVIHARFSDALTTLTEASYTVDSNDEWKDLAADDDIFDSQTETVTFTLGDLDPGEHRVAVRVKDLHGNTRYVSRTITIGG